MKWREPWRNSLRRQKSWKLATWPNCRSAMMWTVALVVIGGLRAYSSDTPTSDLISRAWVAPVFGIGLALILSITHWLSPLKVDSGPRGIVRSKGDSLALVPWQAIRSYRIYELEGERVLELLVTYSAEPERFYLAKKVDERAVEHELRSHVHIEVQQVIPVEA